MSEIKDEKHDRDNSGLNLPGWAGWAIFVLIIIFAFYITRNDPNAMQPQAGYCDPGQSSC